MINGKTQVTYFEYYPHYMAGTLKCSFKMSWDEFISLLSVDLDDDENFDKFVEVAEARAGRSVYALSSLVYDFDLEEIKNVLEERGTWAEMWEEGSFALSIFGKEACVSACAKVEAGLLEEEMGDDDE